MKLLDHDFFIGLQQKLVPSIYGLCEITNTGDVSQSEYNFISIRSGKIDTSNAYKHAFDVRDIFQSKLVKRRPILLMETDGAQDEVHCLILLHEVNTAGLSAFNPVEPSLTHGTSFS